MSNISFGQYLVQLREQKTMSQRKLAELAGVTNSTISRIEAIRLSRTLLLWTKSQKL